MTEEHDLDDPIGASLRTNHRLFADRRGSAVRYRSDFGPFCSVGLEPTAETWASLRELSPEGGALFMTPGFELPGDWRAVVRIPLTQMTDDRVDETRSPSRRARNAASHRRDPTRSV
jgi:hypothetical protein